MNILDYLVAIVTVLCISLLAAKLSGTGKFSVNTFLITIAISIVILIWIPMIPVYFVFISVILIGFVLIGGGKGDEI